MNNIPRRISNIPEERLDKKTDMTREAIAKTLDDIIYDSAVYEAFKEDTNNEQEIFPDIVKKVEKYTPTPAEQFNLNSYDRELQKSLAYIEKLGEKKSTNKDIEKGLHEIEDILRYKKNMLTRRDYIGLLINKVQLLNDQNKKKSSEKVLYELSGYEKYFTQKQKNYFYFFKGNNYYYHALDLSNIKHYDRARTFFLKACESFDVLLKPDTILEDEWYKIIMFKHALCNYRLGDIHKADNILSEISDIPGESNDTVLTANILRFHGHIYQKLQKYQKAIDTYKKYLKYNPNDEDIKKRIRLLSEQLPE